MDRPKSSESFDSIKAISQQDYCRAIIKSVKDIQETEVVLAIVAFSNTSADTYNNMSKLGSMDSLMVEDLL